EIGINAGEQAQVQLPGELQCQQTIAGKAGAAGKNQVGVRATQVGGIDEHLVAAVGDTDGADIFELDEGVVERNTGKLGLDLQPGRPQNIAGNEEAPGDGAVPGDVFEPEGNLEERVEADVLESDFAGE